MVEIGRIEKIVNKFAELADVNNPEMVDKLVSDLSVMNENDVLDSLIKIIYSRLEQGELDRDDVLSNLDLLAGISDDYPTKKEVYGRFEWLSSMNMLHTNMSLTDNHETIIEVFDEFNKLIGINFDAFYTGGLMGYFATNHKLERYHSDLDLFINENQLKELYNLVKNSPDFSFVDQLDDKSENSPGKMAGHEFKITYKDTPISVGLFLFERKENDEVVIKEYYHSVNDPENDLLVTEKHLNPEYAKLAFSNEIREHNGISYKMQSLESIYNAKKNGRPKDRYDADIIREFIDLSIDARLDYLKTENYDVHRKNADYSVVSEFDKTIKEGFTL